MAAQRGKDLLLKIDDGSGHFTTIAGLRTKKLSLNAEMVDITHADSAGRWRELLEGAGARHASISGSGIFKDADSDALAKQVFFDGLIRLFQIIIPDFGIISGQFQLTELDYKGEYKGELSFDIKLESASELNFTPL